VQRLHLICTQQRAHVRRLVRQQAPLAYSGAFLATDEANRCPQLERLTLNKCTQVTDAGIIAIATHCLRLRALDVTGCTLLTHESTARGLAVCTGLEELSPTSSARASLSLVWTACPQLRSSFRRAAALARGLTDGDIALLAQFCPSLQALTLTDCDMLTNAAVLAVAAHCPRLEELCVTRCSLTDASLHALAANCSRLDWLNVNACRALTDAGIMAVVHSCPRLATLQADWCLRLTERCRSELRRHSWRCSRPSPSLIAAARARAAGAPPV
jgi:hypothetical protein